MSRFFAVGIGPLHPDSQRRRWYHHNRLVSLDDADVRMGVSPLPHASAADVPVTHLQEAQALAL